MNKAPAAHVIPGAGFVVDGFRLASSASTKTFFLSHFHADHYDGLTSEWSAGIIYCSAITARLVVTVIGVDASHVKPLPMDQEVEVEGVDVTLLDANHCPGASLLLFRLQDGTIYLHTGDMRYHARMQEYPALQSARGKIDTLFLDTTYSQPKYNFVEQLNAMDYVADAIAELLQAEKDGKSQTKTLFLLSAYKLGKERILLHVAKRTGLPICVDENKLKVLECLMLDEEDMRCFTLDPAATPLHVCRMGFCGEMWPFFRPNFVNMKAYYDALAPHGYTHICGLIPTGWSIGSNYNKRNSRVEKDNMAVTLAPYSEHSNFEGLTEFVKFLRPRCVYATVFKDEKDKKKIEKRFSTLLDSAANKRAFLSLFARPSTSSSSSTAAADSSLLLQRQAELEPQREELEKGDKQAAVPRCPSIGSIKSDTELSGPDLSAVGDVKREVFVCDDEGDDGGFVCAAEDAKIRDADSDDDVVIEVMSPCVISKPDVDRVVSSSWPCVVCTYIHAAHERAARTCAMCGACRPDCGEVALSPKTATPNEKPQSSDRGSSKRVQAVRVQAGAKKQRTLFAYMSKGRT